MTAGIKSKIDQHHERIKRVRELIKAWPTPDPLTAEWVMMFMDGFAGANIEEPSPGDLERVLTAYRECFRERAILFQMVAAYGEVGAW